MLEGRIQQWQPQQHQVCYFIRLVKNWNVARSVPLRLDGCSHPAERRKSDCDRRALMNVVDHFLSFFLLNCSIA